jgi:hypothetical protein
MRIAETMDYSSSVVVGEPTSSAYHAGVHFVGEKRGAYCGGREERATIL